LKEAEMLSPPWIALNRDATVEPLLSHQNPHQSREAGSSSGQLLPYGAGCFAPITVVGPIGAAPPKQTPSSPTSTAALGGFCDGPLSVDMLEKQTFPCYGRLSRPTAMASNKALMPTHAKGMDMSITIMVGIMSFYTS
jgi:hypothetical protein